VSTLLDRPPGAPQSGASARQLLPSPWATGAAAAVQAAAASLVALLVPVVLAWVAASGGRTEWTTVLQAGFCIWLLAQHAGLAVDGGFVGLLPLGLAVVPLASCWYAGRRLGRVLDPNADRIAAGGTRSRPTAPPRSALLAMAAVHGLLGLGIALLAAVDGVRPVLWQGLAGPATVALLGGTLGAAAYRHGTARAGLLGLVARLPDRVRVWLWPACTAVAVQVGVGALVVVVALALGAARVLALQNALGGGAVGVAMVSLGQLALAPNLAVWAAAWLAGPGFAVGAGTSVSPVTTVLGPLPALPVLGALPAPGPMPSLAVAALLVPVLAGVVAAFVLLRVEGRTGGIRLVADLAAVSAGAGLGLGLLGWLSGGPAGPGRLLVTGPATTPGGLAWLAGCFAAEVLVGAGLTVLVRRAVPALVDRLAGSRS
jgi:hypothetical protein